MIGTDPLQNGLDPEHNTNERSSEKNIFFKAIGEGSASPVVELSCPKSNWLSAI